MSANGFLLLFLLIIHIILITCASNKLLYYALYALHFHGCQLRQPGCVYVCLSLVELLGKNAVKIDERRAKVRPIDQYLTENIAFLTWLAGRIERGKRSRGVS